MRTFDIVVAADSKLGIGKNGTLPWKLPGDMAFFKKITTTVSDPSRQNAVIMGRKTWESIPERFRPLPNRLNIVLSRQIKSAENNAQPLVFLKFEEALDYLSAREDIENVFLIGGGELYRQFIQHPACRVLYLTQIKHDFDCDTFLPDFHPYFVEDAPASTEWRVENGIEYQFGKFIHNVEKNVVQSVCNSVSD